MSVRHYKQIQQVVSTTDSETWGWGETHNYPQTFQIGWSRDIFIWQWLLGAANN